MRFTHVIALLGVSSLVSAQATTPWQRISVILQGPIKSAKAPLEAQLKLIDTPPPRLNLKPLGDILENLAKSWEGVAGILRSGPTQELVREARNVCAGFRQPVLDITSEAKRLTEQGMKVTVLVREGRVDNIQAVVTSVRTLNREFTSVWRRFPAGVLQSCRDMFDLFNTAEKALDQATSTWTG
ncbi:hypothetical protein LOZ65_006926 [Ophidiomyces ophidiicola]|nr:hypothetical protein LOZ65_006926 [Ophidiomyces ophidiicola]